MALFMLALVGMLAMVGLVLDGGNLLVQRRVAQNAADAAAMAGARALSQGNTPTVTYNTITTYAQANTGPFTDTTVVDAQFIDGLGNKLGPISGAASIPATTSGVWVQTRRSTPSAFVQILRINSLVADGTAGATVSITPYDAGNSPFIVCGINAHIHNGIPPNDRMNILNGSGPYTLNKNAVKQTFDIYGTDASDTPCNVTNSFDGLADWNSNAGLLTLPRDLAFTTGNVTGQIQARVNIAGGCGAGAKPPYDCIMQVPVASSGHDKVLHAELWLLMYVDVQGNSGTGMLVSPALTETTGVWGSLWTPGQSGMTVIGLAQ